MRANRPEPQSQAGEVALIRSLLRLTEGNPAEFADFRPPPRSITAWLGQADIRQVRGLLIAALQHWIRLRGETPEGP